MREQATQLRYGRGRLGTWGNKKVQSLRGRDTLDDELCLVSCLRTLVPLVLPRLLAFHMGREGKQAGSMFFTQVLS